MPSPRRPRWLVLTALVLVALNLRIVLASVPAVETSIEEATGWSSAVIGALTMLPVICMGAFALLVPRIARRIGRRQTVGLALALITIALALRVAALVPGVLHFSALLAGIGIALAAGLVPSIVREQLSHAVGMATGLWTAAMMTGAALGGALTVPLASAFGSWQWALAVWAIPAFLALVVWWLVEESHHQQDADRDQAVARPPVRIRDLPWHSRPAWSLTFYLTLNSVVFYTTLAWLAPSYVDRTSTPEGAGLLFGVFTGSQIIGALVAPPLVERLRDPRIAYAGSLVMVMICSLLIGWAPTWATAVVASIYGVFLGAGFAMGLALLSNWAPDPAASSRLTAMAFSVTYLLAASGPLLAGALLDATGSWALIFTLIAIACVVQQGTVIAMRRGVVVR